MLWRRYLYFVLIIISEPKIRCGQFSYDMISQSNYIIFTAPDTPRDFSKPIHTPRKCKFQCGNYNKKLVKDILIYNGVQQSLDHKFSIYWGNSTETSNQEASNPLFRFNHFPNSKTFLGNKAEFAYSIQKNPAYNSFSKFMPYTYILPRDREQLFKSMKSHPQSSYIVKPPNGSCGNGIKLVTYSDFYYITPNSVVSEYISRPLCIDGFKFDLRVYVLVTSFAPLRAFVSKEGLARFATESYSPAAGSVYSHLTNATLNKKSKNWENGAFKWKLSELLHEIAHRWNHSQQSMMEQITSIVAKTLAFVQPSMAPRERKRLVEPYFELFGFDIIFDRSFKPYVLEINCMPSLNTEEDVDFEVKAPLVAQALSIAGIPDLSYEQLGAAIANFKLPQGGLDQIEDEIIRQENDRNRLSGNGFIRIFPSEASNEFSQLIFSPKVSIKTLGIQIEQRFSQTLPALVPHQSVSTEQGLTILIYYLNQIEQKLRTVSDPRLVSRVQCFLVAQGYRVARGVVGVRALLLHFINKMRGWAAMTKVTISDGLREEIINGNDDWFKKTLLSCDLTMVKNIRLLFK
ncbi:Tubulin-tyrosine ligase family protein [Tritrichomonas foetus]|uniref:Tubulin-tyrosine ligase family protein n=1 Tax=Tritrichomonas foetus TaxID=1144522 RepID=A0A1J4K1V5_9EUKA|nr:Tubulin-tyrosine ligase family protein [Tritrichomonas foetus]|eukprot:OHT05219.1 Tubulin-tyrosine ligase family protein [Tritrichomonas foetus]